MASVTATANTTMGQYVVSATATGADADGFVLTNTERPSLVVTTNLDEMDDTNGLTSLREAIAYAESLSGPSTITFDPAFFGTKRRTIRLTGGPLVFTDPAMITIVGPGARRLTIGGGGKSGVFDVEGGSLSLSGVTIANGNADLGGGLRNEGGRLVLTNVLIQGNRAIVGGGLFNDGRTTLAPCQSRATAPTWAVECSTPAQRHSFGVGLRRPSAKQPAFTTPKGRRAGHNQSSLLQRTPRAAAQLVDCEVFQEWPQPLDQIGERLETRRRHRRARRRLPSPRAGQRPERPSARKSRAGRAIDEPIPAGGPGLAV